MPNIQAISRERHATQRWKPYTSYAFAATDALCGLVVQELPKAMLALPIAFLAAEGAFLPVALQGLRPGKNLFVALNGRWAVGYVPAAYRSYPFVLANTEDGKQVLAINEDSGLLSDTEGELFFGEDGKPSKVIDDVLKFLNQIAANRQATQRLCAVLQKHNLIQPWPIKLQGAEGDQAAEQNIEGLYRRRSGVEPVTGGSIHGTAQCWCVSASLLPTPVHATLAPAGRARWGTCQG